MCYETQDQDMIQDMAEEAPVHESGDVGSQLSLTDEDISYLQETWKKDLTQVRQDMEVLTSVAEIPITQDRFYKENIQLEIILANLLRESANVTLSIIKAGKAVRKASVDYLVGGDESLDPKAVEDAHHMRVKYENIKQHLNSLP